VPGQRAGGVRSNGGRRSPRGQRTTDHDLVRTTQAVLHSLDITPSLKTGSTDANLLLSRGLPTVTIGLTRGDNAHRLDEYIEVEPLRVGLQQIILLALALSGWQPEAG
jgi:di/tripeptidase